MSANRMSPIVMLSSVVLALILVGCGGATPGSETPGPDNEAMQEAETAMEDAAAEAQIQAAQTGEEVAEAAAEVAAPIMGPQIKADGVTFSFKPTRKAKKVFLAGSFNGWDPSNSDFSMMQNPDTGIFSITVPLSPGVYQYKYVVDGQWVKDPFSPKASPDGFGGQNGMFEVP